MQFKIPKSPYLTIKVIPRSNSNEIIDIFKNEDEEIIKIRIKAPPEKNKANIELIKFLSKRLSLPKENFQIISGKTERLKLIKVKWT